MSSRLFGRSGRHTNPIGVVSILTGVAGALASAILWVYEVEPASRILGRYSAELAAGGLLSEQLASLAAVLGLMAVITSIMASSGWEGGGGLFHRADPGDRGAELPRAHVAAPRERTAPAGVPPLTR